MSDVCSHGFTCFFVISSISNFYFYFEFLVFFSREKKKLLQLQHKKGQKSDSTPLVFRNAYMLNAAKESVWMPVVVTYKTLSMCQ